MQAFITLSSTRSVVSSRISITPDGYLCSPCKTSTRIKELKRGTYLVIVLTVDGQVWKGATPHAMRLHPITLNERVVQVAMGDGHFILLTESGRVYVSSNNGYGQLGLGDRMYREDFTLVEPLPVVKKVAAALWLTLAITEAGEVWVCGGDGYGLLLGASNYMGRLKFSRVALNVSELKVKVRHDDAVIATADGGVLASGLSDRHYVELSTVLGLR